MRRTAGLGKDRVLAMDAASVRERERRGLSTRLKAFLDAQGHGGDWLARKLAVGESRAWTLILGGLPTPPECEAIRALLGDDQAG